MQILQKIIFIKSTTNIFVLYLRKKKISTLFKKDPSDLGRIINEVNPENQWVFDGEGIATQKFDGTSTAIINGELYKRYDAKLKPSKIFEIFDKVSKTSGKPFKNGELVDEIINFAINENTPNRVMGALLKNSDTIVSLVGLQVVGKFTNEYYKPIPTGAIPCQEPDLMSGHHPHWLKCDINKPDDKYFFEAFNALENKEDGTYELCGPKVQSNPEKLEIHTLIKHGSIVLDLESLDFEYLKEYLSNPENDIEGIVFHHKTDGRMCKIRKCDFNIKR